MEHRVRYAKAVSKPSKFLLVHDVSELPFSAPNTRSAQKKAGMKPRRERRKETRWIRIFANRSAESVHAETFVTMSWASLWGGLRGA